MLMMLWCGQLKWDTRNYCNRKTQNITIPHCWVDKEQLIRLIVGIMKDINTAQMVELSNKDGREEKSFRWELLGKILYGRV